MRYVKNHIFRGIGGLLPEHRWQIFGRMTDGGSVREEEIVQIDLWSSFPPAFMTGPSRQRLEEVLADVRRELETDGDWRYLGTGDEWYKYRFIEGA